MRNVNKLKNIALLLSISVLFALNYAHAFNNYGITQNPLDPEILAQSSSGGGGGSSGGDGSSTTGGGGGSSTGGTTNISPEEKPFFRVPQESQECCYWIAGITNITNPGATPLAVSGGIVKPGTMITERNLQLYGTVPGYSPATIETTLCGERIAIQIQLLITYKRTCNDVIVKQSSPCEPGWRKTSVPCSNCTY